MCGGGQRKCVTLAQLVAGSYSGFVAEELNSEEDEEGPPVGPPGPPRTCRLQRLALQQALLTLLTLTLRLVDPLLQTGHVAGPVQRLWAEQTHSQQGEMDRVETVKIRLSVTDKHLEAASFIPHSDVLSLVQLYFLIFTPYYPHVNMMNTLLTHHLCQDWCSCSKIS